MTAKLVQPTPVVQKNARTVQMGLAPRKRAHLKRVGRVRVNQRRCGPLQEPLRLVNPKRLTAPRQAVEPLGGITVTALTTKALEPVVACPGGSFARKRPPFPSWIDQQGRRISRRPAGPQAGALSAFLVRIYSINVTARLDGCQPTERR